MGKRDDAEEYFDEVVLGDIDWSNAPSTDPPRERLLGQNLEAGQIIELLGPPAALNEISFSVVMNGTSVQLNERALIPMVQAAIKYASDDAGQFIGAELDEVSRQDAVTAKKVSKTFGRRQVTFESIDVVDIVVMTITVVP